MPTEPKASGFTNWTFGIFFKRYIIFILIAWCLLFWLNKSISFFSWENYVGKFFNLNDEQTFLTENTNNKKTDLLYNMLNTLSKGKWRVEFTLWEMYKAFKEQNQKDYKEFWWVLERIKNLEQAKLLAVWWKYEAIKLYKVKTDKFSYVMDIQSLWNGKYQIQLYNVQFAWNTFSDEELNKLLVKKYFITKTKTSIVLQVEKNWKKEEMVRLKWKTLTNKLKWANNSFIKLFEDLTKRFQNIKQLSENRKIWVLKSSFN